MTTSTIATLHTSSRATLASTAARHALLVAALGFFAFVAWITPLGFAVSSAPGFAAVVVGLVWLGARRRHPFARSMVLGAMASSYALVAHALWQYGLAATSDIVALGVVVTIAAGLAAWALRRESPFPLRLSVTALWLGVLLPWIVLISMMDIYLYPTPSISAYLPLCMPVVGALSVLASVGLLRGRTWGLLLLPVAGLGPLLWLPSVHNSLGTYVSLYHPMNARVGWAYWPWVGAHLALFLLWLDPIVRFLRRGDA